MCVPWSSFLGGGTSNQLVNTLGVSWLQTAWWILEVEDLGPWLQRSNHISELPMTFLHLWGPHSNSGFWYCSFSWWSCCLITMNWLPFEAGGARLVHQESLSERGPSPVKRYQRGHKLLLSFLPSLALFRPSFLIPDAVPCSKLQLAKKFGSPLFQSF